MQKSPVFADSQPAPRLGVFVWKADLADWSHPTGLRKAVGWVRSARVVFGFSGLDRGASPLGGAET